VERRIDMRVNRNAGFLLLAIYLILVGLTGLGVTFPLLNTIMAICALGAGIFLLIYR
jgi:hypothetical protein